MRHQQPALVVAQVVGAGHVVLVVAPRGHVGRRRAPAHHVVEVLVDRRLAAVRRVGVGEVADHQDERGVVRADPVEGVPELGEVDGVADVPDGVEPEVPGGRGVEGVVGTTADGVVVRGPRCEAAELQLPERPGRRPRLPGRVGAGPGLPVGRRRAPPHVLGVPAPVDRHRGARGEGVVDLVGTGRGRGGPRHRRQSGRQKESNQDETGRAHAQRSSHAQKVGTPSLADLAQKA